MIQPTGKPSACNPRKRRLTPEQRAQVRLRAAAVSHHIGRRPAGYTGESFAKIARDFEIHHSTVAHHAAAARDDKDSARHVRSVFEMGGG